jgi:hypothetical protein
VYSRWSARAPNGRRFSVYDMDSVADVLDADPDDFSDLVITQGKGSQLRTGWAADGWVTVAGRVVDDGVRRLD